MVIGYTLLQIKYSICLYKLYCIYSLPFYFVLKLDPSHFFLCYFFCINLDTYPCLKSGVHNPQATWLSRSIHVALHPISFTFEVDCEEVPLKLQMKCIDLLCSDNLKSKFPTWLDFYKIHMVPCGWFSNLITNTQQIVSMFGTTYLCEQLFSKMKHAKNTLHL